MKRKSLKDTMRDNALAMRYYARMSGKPEPEIPQGSVKRGPRKPSATKSEAQVQREIIDWLLDNRHIALVERHNSGTMQEGNRYVQFNTVMIPARLRPIGNMQRVRKPDLDAMLIDGRRLVVEVKREGWKPSNDIREREQEHYLAWIRKHGGLALFAQSVEDVRKELIVNGYA